MQRPVSFPQRGVLRWLSLCIAAAVLFFVPAPHGQLSSARASDVEVILDGRRFDAFQLDWLTHGGEERTLHDTHDIALDQDISAQPEANSTALGSSPLAAIDGDPESAWRGAPSTQDWIYTLPFRRVVHLGLVRVLFGDSTIQGVPPAYRWEIQEPVDGTCVPWAFWKTVAQRDDRDPNEFVHGPMHVHARHQLWFPDLNACGLRLVVPALGPGDPEGPPVLHSLSIVESAASLTLQPQTQVFAEGSAMRPMSPPPPPSPGGDLSVSTFTASDVTGAIDGLYRTLWAGQPRQAPWVLTITLPTPALIDRISLVLGLDAATVPDKEGPGRYFSASFLPLHYRIEASAQESGESFNLLPEGAPIVDPSREPSEGDVLPVRRRLIHLTTPRIVRRLRLVMEDATGPWGELPTADNQGITAPVVREIGLFSANDRRPVIFPTTFLSVDANPSGLTHASKGETYFDGLFARVLYHRLRRIVMGFDEDTRWTDDASRPRDLGTGEFLETVEGDDPSLDPRLIEAMGQPPILTLSGSLDWDFDFSTGPWQNRPKHWRWAPQGLADSPDRGMGELQALVQGRRAPFLGFCGGAQILALLDSGAPFDMVLARLSNDPIRGLIQIDKPYESTWWYDPPSADSSRPRIFFDPRELLFSSLVSTEHPRDSSVELPSSHGDMLRPSAFSRGEVPSLQVIAWSDFCRPWIDPHGLEPTWPAPDGKGYCLRVPQAFRSVETVGYPVVGFQFHPEQQDLKRPGVNSPPEARGDALEILAASVDWEIERYRTEAWLH